MNQILSRLWALEAKLERAIYRILVLERRVTALEQEIRELRSR